MGVQPSHRAGGHLAQRRGSGDGSRLSAHARDRTACRPPRVVFRTRAGMRVNFVWMRVAGSGTATCRSDQRAACNRPPDRWSTAVPLCGDLRPPRPPRYAESRVTREMISSRPTTGMRMRELTRGFVPGRAPPASPCPHGQRVITATAMADHLQPARSAPHLCSGLPRKTAATRSAFSACWPFHTRHGQALRRTGRHRSSRAPPGGVTGSTSDGPVTVNSGLGRAVADGLGSA